jgi:hypothetical protein
MPRAIDSRTALPSSVNRSNSRPHRSKYSPPMPCPPDGLPRMDGVICSSGIRAVAKECDARPISCRRRWSKSAGNFCPEPRRKSEKPGALEGGRGSGISPFTLFLLLLRAGRRDRRRTLLHPGPGLNRGQSQVTRGCTHPHGPDCRATAVPVLSSKQGRFAD